MKKMVARKLSTKRYVVAGIITTLVFVLGVSLGIIFENARVVHNEELLKDQEASIASLQLQYFYISEMQNSNDVCPVLTTALTDSIERLGESLEKVEQTIADNKINYNEKKRIQRIYMQDNIRYWLFSKTVQEKCNSNVLNILYFFSEDCDVCPNQGVVLSYFKKIYQDKILIFPINTDIDEDMINLIKIQFNVTTYPTLIINDQKFQGIVKKDQLNSILCNAFNETDC